MNLAVVIVWLGAYLISSIPFGVLVARAKGVDIRKVGSGNVGATNVGRVLGKKWGYLVLALDALKGAVPMVIARFAIKGDALPAWGPATANFVLLGAGLACMLGSVAPIYLGFRGGKGVATSLGIVLAVPHLAAAGALALVGYVSARFSTGFVSLGSISAAILLPLGVVLTGKLFGWPLSENYPLLILTGLMAGVVLFRHRANIARLLAGTEPKAGPKPQS